VADRTSDSLGIGNGDAHVPKSRAVPVPRVRAAPAIADGCPSRYNCTHSLFQITVVAGVPFEARS